MTSIRNAILVCAAAGLFGFAMASTVRAEDSFPSKPIKIVVPYPAGGVGDQLARAVQKPMQDFLKQPVIVENLIGAGGVIGSSFVARAPRDGYTLLLGNTGPIAISPQVSKIAYDPLKDFVPISLIAQAPLILAVPAANTAKSVKEFLDQARASGTAWNYGSTGIASLSHLTGEFFNSAAGTRITHVPYNGGAQMVTAFIGGDVQVAFVTGPDSAAMLQSGKIRYLAVASAQKTDIAPDLPTVAEALPGFTSDVWYGILAPAGIPEIAARRLHDAVAHAIAQLEAQKAFSGRYIEVKSSTSAELSERIRSETERWGRVIKAANINLK